MLCVYRNMPLTQDGADVFGNCGDLLEPIKHNSFLIYHDLKLALRPG